MFEWAEPFNEQCLTRLPQVKLPQNKYTPDKFKSLQWSSNFCVSRLWYRIVYPNHLATIRFGIPDLFTLRLPSPFLWSAYDVQWQEFKDDGIPTPIHDNLRIENNSSKHPMTDVYIIVLCYFPHIWNVNCPVWSTAWRGIYSCPWISMVHGDLHVTYQIRCLSWKKYR